MASVSAESSVIVWKLLRIASKGAHGWRCKRARASVFLLSVFKSTMSPYKGGKNEVGVWKITAFPGTLPQPYLLCQCSAWPTKQGTLWTNNTPVVPKSFYCPDISALSTMFFKQPATKINLGLAFLSETSYRYFYSFSVSSPWQVFKRGLRHVFLSLINV